MIQMSLFIQYTHLDRTSLKIFIYLMIDAIKRQNNTRKFDRISNKALEFLNNLSLIKYAKFSRLRESMIKNLHELLKNQIDQ